MINLLPPQIKEQIAFSKRNSKMVKLIWVLSISAAVLGGLFFVGLTYLNARNKTAETELHTALNAPSTEIEKTVQGINQKLSTVKKLGATKHRYSALLRELSAALPPGSFIREISLKGDNKPIDLVVISSSYSSAVAARDSLAALSDRIAGVDIETVSSDSGNFAVTLNVAFKPGMAK